MNGLGGTRVNIECVDLQNLVFDAVFTISLLFRIVQECDEGGHASVHLVVFCWIQKLFDALEPIFEIRCVV